jgi:nitrate reductase gamma subunit
VDSILFPVGIIVDNLGLSPYRQSILKLNPEINAVVQLAVIVQIYIFSAFMLIGMITFTRLIHFLVYPLAYFWRLYQLVIWNYKNNDT